MKNIYLLLIGFLMLSCEEVQLQGDNDFYNKNLNEEINGYEIWATEAMEYAIQNKWSLKINEPLVGNFDIKYSKRKKSNADIKANLIYVLNVKEALDLLESDASKNGYALKEGVVQAGFTFTPRLGNAVYQTWSVPSDSLIKLKNNKVEVLNLDYERFTTGRDQYNNTSGGLVIVDLNSVNSKTILEPELPVAVYSSYGLKGKPQNSKRMPAPLKLKDLN